MMQVLLLVLAVKVLAFSVKASLCFGDVKGNIIMQAENAAIPAGWSFMTKFPNYTGTGYLKYLSDNQYQWAGKDILEYPIYSSTGGTYRINFYTARESTDDCRNDECNDVYVLDGETPKKLLTDFRKIFDEWKYSGQFDVNHVKSGPFIDIPQGASTFRVAGRSSNLMLDHIVLKSLNSGLNRSGEATMVDCATGNPSGMPSAMPSATPTVSLAPTDPTEAPGPGKMSSTPTVAAGQSAGPTALPSSPSAPSYSPSGYACRVVRDRISEAERKLIVRNKTLNRIRIYWVDRKGKHRGRRILEPGAVRRVRAYRYQYWEVVKPSGECIRGFRLGRNLVKRVRIMNTASEY